MNLSILCVTRAFPSHPGEREGNYVLHSLQALARRGASISVLVGRPYVPAWASRWTKSVTGPVDAGAFPEFSSVETVSHLSIPRHLLKPVSNFMFDRPVGAAIARVARTRAFSLIHGHGEDVAPVVARVARATGLPSVVTIHGIDTAPRNLGAPAQRQRLGRALRAVDRVILVGEPLRSAFLGISRREDHFRVVPNGFTQPPPDLPRLAWQRRGSGAGTELISVSNVLEGKGIDITIEALALLARKGFSDWRYRVVGDGLQRPELEHRVRSIGLQDRIEFLGARPHAEVFQLLASADVFVLPSYREAFGIAYLEAMAMGLLAIGVKGQGPDAFIQDGETGFLVEPRDPDSLAGAIETALSRPDRCQAMAEKGRLLATAKWDWDHHARELTKVYDELVRNRS